MCSHRRIECLLVPFGIIASSPGGRRFRRVSAVAVPDERAGLHQPQRQRHQPVFQRAGLPRRGLALPARRLVPGPDLAAVSALLPGVFAGALIRISLLPDPRHFKIFAGLVLLYVAGKMLRDLLSRRRNPSGGTGPATGPAARRTGGSCQVLSWNTRMLAFRFQDQEYRISCRGIVLLSLIVGLVGAACTASAAAPSWRPFWLFRAAGSVLPWSGLGCRHLSDLRGRVA